MPDILSIDIETYSSVSLIDCGVKPYTEAPDFEVMLIAYKINDSQAKIIDLTETDTASLYDDEPLPRGDWGELTKLLFDPAVIKSAYNANFERTCLARHFKSPMPPEQWRCTMVLAANYGLPGSLAGVGAALGLDKQKIIGGKNLIKLFCVPDKDNCRRVPLSAPDKWLEFMRYCLRDVDVECEIRVRLGGYDSLPDDEHRAWEIDQHINDYGVRLDTQLIENAIIADSEYRQRLSAEAKTLTGLSNPNSTTQLRVWLNDHGLECQSLSKDFMPELLEKARTPETKRVLQLRQAMSKTSVKKYEAMQRSKCADGRARNLLQFYGATRTGRWSGRRIQVQNLPQNKLKDLSLARELARNGENDTLELVFGSPSFTLSQLIRTALIPSEGCRFIVADFSAIEARVLAWLAGEQWVLDEFYGDGLIYEATAAQMFHVPKDDIKKGGARADLRAKGKVATLACGYQGGPDALIRMGALRSGIPEEDLPGIVEHWRQANSHIVKYWARVNAAAIRAVKGESTELGHGVAFSRAGDCLYVRLPSGRKLAYYKPELQMDPKFKKMGVTYMGTSEKNGSYTRLRSYGGKLVENITQAVARDCLRDAMLAVHSTGYRIVFHVHDELVLDVPRGGGSLEEVLELMSITPEWAEGLPLKADGYECTFYMKD